MINKDLSFYLELSNNDYSVYDGISDDILTLMSGITTPVHRVRYVERIAFTNKLGNRNFKNYFSIMNSALTSLKSSYTS
jgi:hypothetical protein